jgi:hypothetical protein
MDARVKNVLLQKIEESISNSSEIKRIRQSLGTVPVRNDEDFAFGIAVGRIYNSFHYQTRRILKRNATDEEFAEFLKILAAHAAKIKSAVQAQQ